MQPRSVRRPHSRRDRHGRGFRGDLIPSHLPGFKKKRDVFDTLVMQSLGPLYARFATELEHVHVSVEDVPPPGSVTNEGVVLGRFVPADRTHPDRIVLYRRPIEYRARSEEDLAILIHHLVVDHIALVLGQAPEDIDPDYFSP